MKCLYDHPANWIDRAKVRIQRALESDREYADRKLRRAFAQQSWCWMMRHGTSMDMAAGRRFAHPITILGEGSFRRSIDANWPLLDELTRQHRAGLL